MHFLVTAFTPYEIHRDEFLYLGMGEHLQLWNMDFPPFIAIQAEVGRALFGDTLFAIRFVPAVAGAALVVLTGEIARRLGGSRTAQALAMFTLLCSALFMRPSGLAHPVVFDQFWWALGFYGLVLIAQGVARNGAPREVPRPTVAGWLILGIAGGFGLLTKFSILFFALSVFAGVLVTRHRHCLATRWPWIAVGIALLIGSPTLVGQLRLDFPVLLHMGDLQRQQLDRVTYSEFLLGQVWMLGPALVLAMTGCIWLLASRAAQALRVIATTCVTAFLLLMFLRGKAYYIGPIYPVLCAAGWVCLTNLNGTTGKVLQVGVAVLLFAAGVISIPFGLPVLPPEQMAGYSARLGVKAAVTTNRGTVLPLPQDYADMLGWEQQVQAVARVYEKLTSAQREKSGFIARNYGQAGALEFYGPRFNLPERIMLPDNFQLWPADDTRDVVVTVGIPEEDLRHYFRTVTLVERFDHPWRVEEERNVPICIAETPTKPVSTAWRRRTGWKW